MHDELKFYGTATVGARGQIVIPAEARAALELSESEKLLILGGPHKNSLVIVKGDALKEILGKMTSKFDLLLETMDNESENFKIGGSK